jgi:hypothetical protein
MFMRICMAPNNGALISGLIGGQRSPIHFKEHLMNQRSTSDGSTITTSETAGHRSIAAITQSEAQAHANPSMAAMFGIVRPPLFPLGRIVITPSAEALLKRSSTDATKLPARHQSGDHGDFSPDQIKASERALQTGAPIKSAYDLGVQREPIWIITTASRNRTTLLLPHEEQ